MNTASLILPLRVELFGGFVVSSNQSPLEGFVSNKTRALLAYLFFTRKPQSRQVLAEMFWGDKSDAAANANLRVALSNLRAIVGSHLSIGRLEVGVNPVAPCEVDVDKFLQVMERFAPRGQEIDAQSVEQALALYKGDLLDGLHVRDAQSFDEWLMWQRERLRQMALQGLHKLALYYTECNNYDAALKATRRLLDLEPWQEDGHRHMMLLLALTGNRNAAIAQYDTCRRILARELNVPPLPETNALLERIKAMPKSSAAPAPLEKRHALFGRAEEYAWLTRQWRQVTRIQGRLTLVEGEMGIGKTQLIEEVLHALEASGVLILRARCHEFGQDVMFEPIADLLRQGLARQSDLLRSLSPVWLPHLAAILPEVNEELAARGVELERHNGNMAALHLFEAVHQTLRALARTRPAQVAIFLDDLHWIDSATVDLLRYLVHRLTDLPIWLVGAYQQEGIGSDHPLLRLRTSLIVEDRASLLRLERLDARAIADWVNSVPGLEDEQRQQLTELILQRGQGNPFITSQILRDFHEAVSLAKSNGGPQPPDNWSLRVRQIPFAVREIVLLKLNRLTPTARYLLCEAAAIGEQFELQALAWSDTNYSIAGLLNECLERGLITPVSPGVFRFVHPMIREIAAEWLIPWQRQRIGAARGRSTISQGAMTFQPFAAAPDKPHLPIEWFAGGEPIRTKAIGG